jgi:hypothetical protein
MKSQPKKGIKSQPVETYDNESATELKLYLEGVMLSSF